MALSSDGKLRWDVPRAFRPLLTRRRYKFSRGGRASAKSHHFGEQAVIAASQFPGLRICCLRQVQKSIKRSSKQIIVDKIEKFKLPGFKVKNDEIVLPGRGVCIFQGMQDHTAESIKSLEGFDIFWFAEANKATEFSLRILRPTARSTERSRLKVPELWFDWNAFSPKDPIDEFARATPPDSVFVKTTFRDNPWFPPELVPELEWDRKRNYEKYLHVWEGEYAQRSEARVFNNWRVEEFELGQNGIPMDPVWYWGADWGYSVDPTVLIGCFIVGRTLYVRYEAWKVGCEIDDTPKLFDGVNPDVPKFARQWTITADSARADTIAFMRRHGYAKIAPARKGAGSVEDGVEFLKNYDIVVHPDCVHTADELEHYSWKVDKLTEQVLPVLVDAKNHTIDALRYSVEDVRWVVEGGVASTPSEVSTRYDGSTQRPRATVEDVGVEMGGFAGSSYEGVGADYDGGLS